MSTLKATFGGVVVLIATLAMIAFAQAQSKSSPVTSLEEGEAIYVGKNGTVHKSNTKVSAAKHEAALKRGAVELSRPDGDVSSGRPDVHVRWCCGRHQRGRGFPRSV